MAYPQTPQRVEAAFHAETRQEHDHWVTEIRLGDGAIVSKWFDEEDDARRYPLELGAWLRRKEVSAARRIPGEQPGDAEGVATRVETRSDRYRRR